MKFISESSFADERIPAADLAGGEGDVLSISDSRKLCELLNVTPKSFVEATHPECNFPSLPYPDESFD